MPAKPSSKKFDEELQNIDHYKRYRRMLPYIGGNYEDTKTLIIGESFYLPNECRLNKNAEKWYNSSEDELTDYEKEWIDCRGLIECEWKSDGHFIYKELNRIFQSIFNMGFEKVAFMNAFQRPACQEGRSFKYDCKKIDVDVACDTINEVQKILEPEKVIFISKYAWDRLNRKIVEKNIAKIYDFSCHPGASFYWNRLNYLNGKLKFIEVLTGIKRQI